MLSEKRQSWRSIYYMIILIWHSWNDKITMIENNSGIAWTSILSAVWLHESLLWKKYTHPVCVYITYINMCIYYIRVCIHVNFLTLQLNYVEQGEGGEKENWPSSTEDVQDTRKENNWWNILLKESKGNQLQSTNKRRKNSAWDTREEKW